MINQDKAYRLSILLVTYNHEKYIAQALNSLLQQNIEGPIELVVADDCSTDNTLAMIKEYEEKDSRFHFKYLSNTSNLGITKNYQRGFAACSGDYVAVLEGDDYWIKGDKLKQQQEFLDTHWICDLCTVNYFVYEESCSRFTPRIKIDSGHYYISAPELIADNIVGNFSTCMYRRSALLSLPEALFELRSYDWIVNICIAQNSLIGFLKEPMSVYRLHTAGSWSNINQLEKIKAQLALIPAYNELTQNRFDQEFSLLTAQLKETLTVMGMKHNLKCFDKMPNWVLRALKNIIPSRLKTFICRAFSKTITE